MPLTPITIVDSGLGGLTVLCALRERLPSENFFAHVRFRSYGDQAEAFLQEKHVLIPSSWGAAAPRPW